VLSKQRFAQKNKGGAHQNISNRAKHHGAVVHVQPRANHAKAVVRWLSQWPAAPLPTPLDHSFLWQWHGHMLRWCITCLHAKYSQKHRHSSCINRGAHPLKHTLILSIASHTSLSSCSFYFLSCLEPGKATMESLAPWKK
jgi:hypothetical protein